MNVEPRWALTTLLCLFPACAPEDVGTVNAGAEQVSEPVAFGTCGAPAEGSSEVGPLESVYVTMRDGVRVAVDVILPDPMPSGGVPTLLVMTRYWRAVEGAPPSQIQEFFVRHGYAVVWGDVRGTGASFGTWPHHRARDETLDFTDVMDWITDQSWSDGQVAAWGTSYTANTADWMAERRHPALKAVVSRFPDYDPYADLYFPGGVPNAYMGSNWGARVKEMDLNTPRTLADGSSVGVRPVDDDPNGAELAAAVDARRDVPGMYESMRHIVFKDDGPEAWDGVSMDWWGIHAHKDAVEASGVPIHSWGSWMDAGTANGVLHRYMTLSNPQRVFVGAWSHGGTYDADPFNEVDRPNVPSSSQQFVEDLCFLDQHLKGADNAWTPGDLVYYTMGADRWTRTSSWPPPATDTELFLGNGGDLSTSPPDEAGQDTYEVDYGHTTGQRNRWATNNGAGDVVYAERSPAADRLLTYTSQPLEVDVEVTGQPVVTVFMSSTHPDAALFAYLEDVAPDGTVTYVGEGQIRLLHRQVSDEGPPYRVVGPYHSYLARDAMDLVPGDVVEVAFELHPLSVVFRAGHRLRLSLGGADIDTFQRIPESGDPTWTVHWGADTPSRFVVPVLAGSLR